MYNVIFKRRSVRFFKSNPISKVDMREILRAGMWAPSAKNRQPWKFVVVRGKSKDEMLALMEKGIERSEKGEGVLAGSSDLYTNARFTLKCMKEAYNIVFIVNPNGRDIEEEWTPADKIHELSDVQAIGAAAQNMALQATSMGIGSLWIGNIFFAYEELTEWLGKGQMVLAMAFSCKPQPLPARQKERRRSHRS